MRGPRPSTAARTSTHSVQRSTRRSRSGRRSKAPPSPVCSARSSPRIPSPRGDATLSCRAIRNSCWPPRSRSGRIDATRRRSTSPTISRAHARGGACARGRSARCADSSPGPRGTRCPLRSRRRSRWRSRRVSSSLSPCSPWCGMHGTTRQPPRGRPAPEHSRRLRQKRVRSDASLSLLLARAAVRAQRSPETISQLHASVHGSLERARLTGHGAAVTSLDWSADGTQVATGCDDGRARLFRAEGTHVCTVPPESEAAPLGNRGTALSPSASRLATIQLDGTARLWSAAGALIARLDDATGPVHGVEFLDDDTVATVGSDGRIALHDATGALKKSWRSPREETAQGHAVSLDLRVERPTGSPRPDPGWPGDQLRPPRRGAGPSPGPGRSRGPSLRRRAPGLSLGFDETSWRRMSGVRRSTYSARMRSRRTRCLASSAAGRCSAERTRGGADGLRPRVQRSSIASMEPHEPTTSICSAPSSPGPCAPRSTVAAWSRCEHSDPAAEPETSPLTLFGSGRHAPRRWPPCRPPRSWPPRRGCPRVDGVSHSDGTRGASSRSTRQPPRSWPRAYRAGASTASAMRPWSRPTGRHLVYLHGDRRVRVLGEDGSEVSNIVLDADARHANLDPRRGLLLTTGTSGAAWVHDLEGTLVRQLPSDPPIQRAMWLGREGAFLTEVPGPRVRFHDEHGTVVGTIDGRALGPAPDRAFEEEVAIASLGSGADLHCERRRRYASTYRSPTRAPSGTTDPPRVGPCCCSAWAGCAPSVGA